MFKKTLIVTLLATASFGAYSQVVAGVGYTQLTDEDEDAGIDYDFNLIVGSIGYKHKVQENFSIMPELRLGFAVDDDEAQGIKLEIDTFFAISVRGQYEHKNGLYAFAAPSYAYLDTTASGLNDDGDFVEVGFDDWEFGFGVGGGYKFHEKLSGEIMYEYYDGTDAFGLGLKFHF